jgi:hypothetical protein
MGDRLAGNDAGVAILAVVKGVAHLRGLDGRKFVRDHARPGRLWIVAGSADATPLAVVWDRHPGDPSVVVSGLDLINLRYMIVAVVGDLHRTDLERLGAEIDGCLANTTCRTVRTILTRGCLSANVSWSPSQDQVYAPGPPKSRALP